MKRLINLFILCIPFMILPVLQVAWDGGLMIEGDSFRFLVLLFFLGSCGGFLAVIIHSTLVAGRISLVEAAVWNLVMKVVYFLAHLKVLFILYDILEASLATSAWLLVLLGWIPPLFNLYLALISGIYSIGIYGVGAGKRIWQKGIVIMLCCFSFVPGVDLIVAVIHICACFMSERERLQSES